LVSTSGYSDEHKNLLEKLIYEDIELFCAVGKDCEIWEEAMDWVCVDLDVSGKKPDAFCTTTSHPDETVEQVIEFATNWNMDQDKKCDVNVIEI